ncbi:hypothetical protein [Variovorax ginsengisoli]|uniref:Uncharacterized protein n=1 Tax=Variovorax ginsengisoli TaxID=363844 RepID=A0ABT8SG16_9BURK|nr:hypothetical protein [Variovorax ginsengisoli]MDN8618654.1 hypothetical protein [Variovorax ginsengisoli]MDO1537824.1 hypothetical protein [Variovorax ginsengisoli]
MPSLSLRATNAKNATISAPTAQRRGRDFHTESNAKAAAVNAVPIDTGSFIKELCRAHAGDGLPAALLQVLLDLVQAHPRHVLSADVRT